uniref:Urotensin 1 n=1 Tax=Oryzias sinensis TaxID=183150 RepID=A0A8C7ZI39_9TELE
MKPLLLLLLLSSVLLSSHPRSAAGRPLRFPGWLEEALLGAAPNGSALDEAEDTVQKFLLQRSPYPLHLLPPAEDSGEDARRTATRLLKRSEEPPLSIDLTFHLLRNMIQVAKIERQRARAQLNRKLLDEVGR